MRKLLSILFLVAVWFAMSGASCNGPGPTPTPSPTPLPSPSGTITIQNGDFSPPLEMGCYLCCDNPLTAFYDEGLVDGWSIGAPESMQRVAAGGCKHTVLRLGCFSDVGPGYLDVGEVQVQWNEAHGIVSLVSAYDSWALANGWYCGGHRCDVTHGPPPQDMLDWMKTIGTRFGKYKHVIFELSNEGFRCDPSPEFEQAMADALRSGFPEGPTSRLVGSQFYPGTVGTTSLSEAPVFRPKPGVRPATGYGDRPRNPSAQGVRPVTLSLTAQAARPIFDFVTYGAVDILASPPLAPLNIPAIIVEDNGAVYTVDQWRRFNERRPARVSMGLWRGAMAWWEEDDFLRHPLPVPGLIDCATPPTGLETCKLKGEPGFTTKYAAAVDASISEATSQHPENYRKEGDLYFVDTSRNEEWHIQFVNEGLRRRGYCSGTYHGEEIAVMRPDDRSLSENYDLLRSDGLVRFTGHAATCSPGTIVGGANDATNGPWSSSPPPTPIPPTPTPGPQPSPGPTPTPVATPTPPVAGCPPGAPPINKIKVSCGRAGNGADAICDGTPFVHDAAWCANVNGQLDCPYGPEGSALLTNCETAMGAPYVWSWNGAPCDGGVCYNNGNPPNQLQIRIPGAGNQQGVGKVCESKGGVCGEGRKP